MEKQNKIGLITIKSEDSEILKQKMPDFDFTKHSLEEINKNIDDMKIIMRKNQGVGLSANQAGINWKMFIAEYQKKFYVIFNPCIIKKSQKMSVMEEECLSVPDYRREITRFENITIEAQDKKGKKIKIKTFGVLARIFQHEIDHLNGKLITDYK